MSSFSTENMYKITKIIEKEGVNVQPGLISGIPPLLQEGGMGE